MSTTAATSDSPAQTITHSAADSTCRLLKLPAELRNRIYRLALVQEDDIVYNKGGYDRPALLNTSKQVRSEALEIFYYENRFSTLVLNYNITTTARFSDHLSKMGLDGSKVKQSSRTVDQPSWANLLQWIKIFHASDKFARFSKVAKLQAQNFSNPDLYILAGMFDTARTLRGQPWAIVEQIMLSQRSVLGAVVKQWLED